jgi:hypothetical protein
VILTADRAGGFAGWHERLGPIDTSQGVSNGETLEKIVREADFFNLPSEYKSTPYPEGYALSLTVEESNRTHTVTWRNPGSEVPDSLNQILSAMDESSDWERIER